MHAHADQKAVSGHAVVIAGGGPTGLMLAGELALARRRRRHCRAARQPGPRRLRAPAVLHSRTHRGARSARHRRAVPLAGAGRPRSRASADDRWTSATFPRAIHYGLALWQNHIERILAGWVDEPAGADLPRTGGDGLRAGRHRRRRRAVRTATRCGAEYLVGCDGGRSLVRKAAGIEFPGWDPTVSFLIAEVEMTEEPEWGMRRDAIGHPRPSSGCRKGRCGSCLTERAARPGRRADPATSSERRSSPSTGPTTDLHNATWISRFTDMTSAGGVLPGRTRAAGRRRGARALPGGRTGPQHSACRMR